MRVVPVAAAFRTAVLLWCVVAARPALAQELLAPPAPSALPAPSVLPPSSALPAAAEPSGPVASIVIEKARRPGPLVPLYGSLVALQGLDFHSTRRALESGARESNPAMRPVVRHDGAFLAVKAGATVGVIWASEKLWKKNRKAAILCAGLMNGAMAAVVAHNYRVSR